VQNRVKENNKRMLRALLLFIFWGEEAFKT